jgi:selenocysteine-specific elongation factor
VLEIVGVLQRTGRLIKITPELSLAGEHHQRLVDLCRERLQKDNALDVQALKAMTGLTRKFAVPFLEHLDTLQVTVRRGDTRVRGPRA